MLLGRPTVRQIGLRSAGGSSPQRTILRDVLFVSYLYDAALTYGGIKKGYDATKQATSSRMYRDDLNNPFSPPIDVVVGLKAMKPGFKTSAAG